MIINGITGTHIATNIPVDIPFNSKQMQLALDKNPDTMNTSWDMVCDICVANGFLDPRGCLLYTSPSPRDVEESRMPSSA